MLNPYTVGLLAKERREEQLRLFSRAHRPRTQGESRRPLALGLGNLLTFTLAKTGVCGNLLPSTSRACAAL
jgi:hypothetical protein